MDKPPIKTQESRDDTIANPRSLCLICKKSTTKYICPKCNLPYCSLDCYKKHSGSCTESFYRENVVDVMKGQRASADEQKQMAKILRRVHEADQPLDDLSDSEDSDTEDAELLQLASLNLDDPNVIARLSKKQLEEFHKAVAEGKLSVELELWQPWWKGSHPTSKIQILDDEIDSSSKSPSQPSLPAIRPDIAPLSTLLKTEPSPLIMFSLLDVLYAYCFTKRLYNGDWGADVEGVVTTLLSLSDILTKNTVYQSVTQVVNRSLELSLQPHVKNTLVFSVSILEDVSDIIKRREFRLAAVSDFLSFIGSLLGDSAAKPREKSPWHKKVVVAEKKLLFLLSWTNEQPDALFSALDIELAHEIATRKEVLPKSE